MGRVFKFATAIIFSIFFLHIFTSSAKATITFSISNPIIDSNDQIQVDASISGLISSSCSTTGCYLQAEMQSAGGYFGYTYNNSGDFVDYFKTPGSTDEIKSKLFNFVPVSGSWSGKLMAEGNPLSSNYYGPGDYLLSFRRFSGNSVNPTSGDSNSLSVGLTMPLPTPSPTSAPQITPTPSPTPTPFILKTPDPTQSPSPTPIPIKTPSPPPIKTMTPMPMVTYSISSDSSNISDVLGVQDNPTTSDLPSVSKSGNGSYQFPILAIGCVILGVGFIGFSIFSIIKSAKKSYNIESEKEDSQIS